MRPEPQPAPDPTSRRLQALRQLLRRDVLSHADWDGALGDAARMAREALAADAGLIALWEDGGGWSAWTHEGRQLHDVEIRLVASRSVLEQVRTGGQPLVSRERLPVLGRSASATRHDLGYVLAIPLHWWEAGQPAPTPRFAGCLYADRRGGQEPFAEEDVELLRDLAATVERTLGLLRHVARLAGTAEAWREQATALQREAAEGRHAATLASRDPRFRQEVLAPLERAAEIDRVGILLLGPTGSGKTHLAYTFHAASRRHGGPFVVLDCGQVTSSEALAAELFGYGRRSGFAAPPEGRPGKARLASGGTLFLDEIAAMPLELQQRLLRLVQFGRFAPLGEAEEQVADLQIVAAANEDLAVAVRAGRFREDLYWRLAEMVIRVPPLDAHPADIPGLAERFLAGARSRFGRSDLAGFTPAALAALERHPWSRAGNIRGLEHTIHRSVLLAPSGVQLLDVGELSFVAALVPADGVPATGGAFGGSEIGSGHGEPAVAGGGGESSVASPGGVFAASSAADGLVVGRLPRVEGPAVAGVDRRRPSVNTAGRDPRSGEALGTGGGAAPLPPSDPAALLAAKLAHFRGNLTAVAADPEVVALFAPGAPIVPPSTLRLRIRQLDLAHEVEVSREPLPLERIVAALRRHGDGSAAAAALGLTRDQLVWQLRRRGLNIRGVLADESTPGGDGRTPLG